MVLMSAIINLLEPHLENADTPIIRVFKTSSF